MAEVSKELEAAARALFRRHCDNRRWSLDPPDWYAWPGLFHEICIEDARAVIGAVLLEPTQDLKDAAWTAFVNRASDPDPVYDIGVAFHAAARHILGDVDG